MNQMFAALARLLRFGALAASFVIIASFAMFATDQVNGASKQQQTEEIHRPALRVTTIPRISIAVCSAGNFFCA